MFLLSDLRELSKILNISQVNHLAVKTFVFTALCKYGLCSDSEVAEEAILNSMEKDNFVWPVTWRQAIFTYLWHNVSEQSAIEWENYCYINLHPIFTNLELDQIRRKYLCSYRLDDNIARIIINLDFSELDTLTRQLRFVNANEKDTIIAEMPLLAKFAKWIS